MLRNLSIFSFRISRSVIALLIVVITFITANILIFLLGPKFDSNFALMATVNDKSWIEGGDVLFLGDSRGHQGLIPSVFEQASAELGQPVSAFNLSRPGLQAPFTYYFSKLAADKARNKPKAIVVNFSFYLLGGQQWMKDIYWAYYRPDIATMQDSCTGYVMECEDVKNWYLRTRFPALLFRKRANNMIKSAAADPSAFMQEMRGISDFSQSIKFEVDKGYFSRGNEYITEEDLPPLSYSVGIERGYSIYQDYVRRLFEESRENGVQVFVYRFPWPVSRGESSEFQEILDYYWDLLKAQADNSPNVVFLDETMFWPNELFVDPLHVNDSGAQRLTKHLAKTVVPLLKK